MDTVRYSTRQREARSEGVGYLGRAGLAAQGVLLCLGFAGYAAWRLAQTLFESRRLR